MREHKAPTLALADLHNRLPNSGPLILPKRYTSAREVAAQFPFAAKRRQGIEGAEGFAVDDALFDSATQTEELWSYAPLASYLATFAYAHYRTPSILELGCGPAHLFFFLRDLGLWDYVGIDGNPLFIEFNPHLWAYAEHFQVLNLQEPIQLQDVSAPVQFDMVCSFEVLEHMREDAVDHFIRTICNHMHGNSVAFCSASLQENMDVHILVRDRTWWLERFGRFGLVPRKDETELVRAVARNHPFNWLPVQSNVFALEKR